MLPANGAEKGGNALLYIAGAGYSDTGWVNYTGDGYGGSLRFIGPGSGANTATWQFTGLAAGNYDVQLTWSAFSNSPPADTQKGQHPLPAPPRFDWRNLARTDLSAN